MTISRYGPVAVAAGLLLFGLGCRGTAPPAPPQFEPAESLLSIVAELQRYRDADLYRFGYPRDVTGQNVYKATLVRLGNYETLHPDRFRELIAFTRAQAYARLGDYATAVRFCGRAIELDGDLRERAAADRAMFEDFGRAIALESEARTLEGFRERLGDRIDRCRALVDRCTTAPWQSLARVEWEQAEVDLVEFLWANRQVIAGGPREALEMLNEMRERHSESHNVHRHTMRLGDWHAELAREYAILSPPERLAPPDRASFVWEEFEKWTTRAKELYLEVAQSYGADERLESARKLAAVEAFEHRIRELHQ